MDDETRFWIAQQVAKTKNTTDITPLFKKGKGGSEHKTKHSPYHYYFGFLPLFPLHLIINRIHLKVHLS